MFQQTVLSLTIADCNWNLTENLLNPYGLVTGTPQVPDLSENYKFMPVSVSVCLHLHFHSFVFSECFILVRVTGDANPENTGCGPGLHPGGDVRNNYILVVSIKSSGSG